MEYTLVTLEGGRDRKRQIRHACASVGGQADGWVLPCAPSSPPALMMSECAEDERLYHVDHNPCFDLGCILLVLTSYGTKASKDIGTETLALKTNNYNDDPIG